VMEEELDAVWEDELASALGPPTAADEGVVEQEKDSEKKEKKRKKRALEDSHEVEARQRRMHRRAVRNAAGDDAARFTLFERAELETKIIKRHVNATIKAQGVDSGKATPVTSAVLGAVCKHFICDVVEKACELAGTRPGAVQLAHATTQPQQSGGESLSKEDILEAFELLEAQGHFPGLGTVHKLFRRS